MSRNRWCASPFGSLLDRGQAPILRCEQITESRQPEPQKLTEASMKTVETDITTNMQRNPEF
jgi:hypothetical protein